MKKILITGGNGYIASSLREALKNLYDITVITRDDVDLTNSLATATWFTDKQFDLVIHTAIKGGNRLVIDNTSVLDNNLQMYFNLLSVSDHYEKFVNIGSGAELYATDTMYGLSKHVIRTSLLEKENFYNLRIFAIFDENELDRRFIKSNLLRYINHQDMIINQNKIMDFFYMQDFITLIKYYIENAYLEKEIDCCYSKKHDLYDLAVIINSLGEHTSRIITETSGIGMEYHGNSNLPDIELIGLFDGIKNVYEKLSCKK